MANQLVVSHLRDRGTSVSLGCVALSAGLLSAQGYWLVAFEALTHGLIRWSRGQAGKHLQAETYTSMQMAPFCA